MPLSITVALLTGAYEAGDAGDSRYAEWPPHPARLFCALVSAARSERERAALRWLERQPPPQVHAPQRVLSSRSSAYVVVNNISTKGGSLTHPGRSNQLRTRSRSFPASPRARFVWSDADASAELVGVLDDVCARVPYLGRSTGVAAVAASASLEHAPVEPPLGLDAPAGGWEVFEPCDVWDAELVLRVPYPGYQDQLDELHAADRPAWQASRSAGYRVRRAESASDQARAPVQPSVYRDVVIFRLAGLRPDGRLTSRLTEALRSKVLRAAGKSAPAALSGHGADGRPHVAFLALPDVGAARAGQRSSEASHGSGRRADGHLLGLAVAVPDLGHEEGRAVLSAVFGLRSANAASTGAAESVRLGVPGLGEVDLVYQPGLVRPWGATPERWRRGGDRWVTATPMVLDRHPKRGNDVDVVVQSLLRVGLPEPVDIRVSTEPLLEGAVRLRPHDLPRQVQGRQYRHVAVSFGQRVAGPVLAGAGRYLGIGLFAPVAHEQAEAAVGGRG